MADEFASAKHRTARPAAVRSEALSELPHNAYYDAMALREYVEARALNQWLLCVDSLPADGVIDACPSEPTVPPPRHRAASCIPFGFSIWHPMVSRGEGEPWSTLDQVLVPPAGWIRARRIQRGDASYPGNRSISRALRDTPTASMLLYMSFRLQCQPGPLI